MRKHLATFWRIVREEALFLWHYRREKRRREDELEDLEQQMNMWIIGLAFAMIAEKRKDRQK